MEKPLFIKFDQGNFRMLPQDIKPIPGYIEPINEETGELFPYCCPHHKQIFDDAVNWFSKFPNCCEEHKKLPQTHLFEKEKYEGTPLKIVKQISFTEHQIIEVIDKPDWYKHVVDYIEYNLLSFGQPNIGAEIYMKWIISFINNENKKIPTDKKQKIISYLNSCYSQNPKSESQITDWNILNSTYQSWLKIFPFELTTYFGNLKQHFENILPFLNGPIEENIYSGIAKSRLHTKASLFEALIVLTNELLTQINGVSLFEKGLISDTAKIKLELINANRSQKLKKGYHNSSPNEEHRYRKMIKDWLKDEKDYFNEISPLLKPLQPQNMESSINPFKYLEFKKSSFYSNLLEENNFTTEEADELYQFLIETLNMLEKTRSNELKSHNLIIERAKGLDKNPLFDRMSRMFQHWLVKALKNDDSYVYAFNYLAQKTNREMHMKVYDVKLISDADLFFMLEKDQLSKAKLDITEQLSGADELELMNNSSQMNYLEIILKGYTDINCKDNLSKYFNREFKKAEREYYDVEEFFSGCLNVIQGFENNLMRQLQIRKFELFQVIDICKKNKEPFEEVVAELNSVSLDNFSIPLASITNNKYSGHFWNNDVINIKNGIKDAYFKIAIPKSVNDIGKPAILPSTLTSLPPIEDVFFIHYQCDKFEEGDRITSLCVYDNIDIKIFNCDEAKAIELYSQKVDELSAKGLIPIHWDQNSPHFGVDHIKERYKTLTGKDINILYPGSLNLADYLKFKYGENYVPHRRLDNLARLNGFSGIYETENGNKTFARDRILLLSKIYFNELKGSLKTSPDQSTIDTVKNVALADFEEVFEENKLSNLETRRKIDQYVKSNPSLMNKFGINVEYFFDNIRESDITQIEIYNTVEKLTDNFKVDKLKILQKDFDFYLFQAKEEKSSEFDENDIKLAIDELQKQGKEIPFKFLPSISKDESGKTIITPNANKYIDKEKLLYPFDFFNCYLFQTFVAELIKNYEANINKSEPDSAKTQDKSDSIKEPKKTKSHEYKDKLDFSLSYYSEMFSVVNAIVLADYEGVVDSINDLNEKGIEVAYNEKSLTEQVHFDLSTEEASIYYNYGIKRINEILDTFYLISSRITEFHTKDEVLNKDIQEIWHEQSNLGWGFVLYSDSSENFVKDLTNSIEKNILSFRDKFISSASLNANIKITQVPLNDRKENTDQINKSTPNKLPIIENGNSIDVERSNRIKEAIDDHMEEFKTAFQNVSDFNNACLYLQNFFENINITISKPLFVKRGNKVRMAFVLGSLYKDLKTDPISLEYLQSLVRLFTVFQDENLIDKSLISTNLYKYCTTKS